MSDAPPFDDVRSSCRGIETKIVAHDLLSMMEQDLEEAG